MSTSSQPHFAPPLAPSADPTVAANDDAVRPGAQLGDGQEQAWLESFGASLDAIRKRVEGQLGAEDVAYIKRVERFSRAMEAAGRLLLHTGRDPVTFAMGVGALWLHKQLQATEIGHTALHGAYDKLEGGDRFHSKGFKWETPIDEESWRKTHNVRHHQYTNVVGRDPDVSFGAMRNAEHLPYDPDVHPHGVMGMFILAANFTMGIQAEYTGWTDYYGLTGRDDLSFIKDRSPETRREVWTKMLRKVVPYYGREYAWYPLLAGTGFFRVLAGNAATELMRDLYCAATIFCGHISEDVKDYPEGTKAGSRANWYKMQVEGTQNFQVPKPVSQLCGALDLQIEHHLFPKLPPNRLREIAPQVRAVCKAHGVKYQTGSWPSALRGVLRRIRSNSRSPAA